MLPEPGNLRRRFICMEFYIDKGAAMIDSTFNPLLRQYKSQEVPQANVAELRQKLIALKVWPEAGDAFLALLPVSRWNSPPVTEEDNHWLHLVVRDALSGHDIGADYPAFFQKLITNPNLRQAFMAELESQEARATNNRNGHMGGSGILKQ